MLATTSIFTAIESPDDDGISIEEWFDVDNDHNFRNRAVSSFDDDGAVSIEQHVDVDNDHNFVERRRSSASVLRLVGWSTVRVCP